MHTYKICFTLVVPNLEDRNHTKGLEMITKIFENQNLANTKLCLIFSLLTYHRLYLVKNLYFAIFFPLPGLKWNAEKGKSLFHWTPENLQTFTLWQRAMSRYCAPTFTCSFCLYLPVGAAVILSRGDHSDGEKDDEDCDSGSGEPDTDDSSCLSSSGNLNLLGSMFTHLFSLCWHSASLTWGCSCLGFLKLGELLWRNSTSIFMPC